ncbi:hypothetical protein JTB14_038007 [Gonioctena quinquepunctata]|nr:hypothetical protein JTB14_038007 [Gonioctena quinquepunctata]
MPRKYIEKTAEILSLENFFGAVRDLKNKNSTYRQASREYNIPEAVIFHRMKGRSVAETRTWEHDVLLPMSSRRNFRRPLTDEELLELLENDDLDYSVPPLDNSTETDIEQSDEEYFQPSRDSLQEIERSEQERRTRTSKY